MSLFFTALLAAGLSALIVWFYWRGRAATLCDSRRRLIIFGALRPRRLLGHLELDPHMIRPVDDEARAPAEGVRELQQHLRVLSASAGARAQHLLHVVVAREARDSAARAAMLQLRTRRGKVELTR